VNSSEELSKVIDLLLSSVTSNVATRTEVVTSDQIQNALDESSYSAVTTDVAQYEFNTGYKVAGGEPWKGFLYRQGFTCSSAAGSGTGAATDLLEIHDLLAQQATAGNRQIFTVDKNLPKLTGAAPYATSDIQHGLPDSSLLLIGTGMGGAGTGFDDCDFGGPVENDICASKEDIIAVLKEHLYGEGNQTKRAAHPLGDIYNSTPAILAPPLDRLPIASYDSFKELTYSVDGNNVRYVERPPYLYVGTNDGILHGFNTWVDSADDNPETWGYVPEPLVESLVSQFPITWNVNYDSGTGLADGYTVAPADIANDGLYQHIFGVDGSPVASDIRLYRPAELDASFVEEEWWKSVVIGGLGKGGYGYYALDVTNPETQPRFRWEISMNLRGNNEEADEFYPGGQFFFGIPIAKPTLAYLYINGKPPGKTTDSDHEIAAAILPGGFINDAVGGVSQSTGVAVVRVADGQVIRKLKTSEIDDICDSQSWLKADNPEMSKVRTAQLIGEPAVPYSVRTGIVSDEAFMGDDRGRIWRLEMEDKDPDEWCIELFFDTLLSTHYPYQDCLIGDDSCCDEKMADPTESCLDADIEGFAIDSESGVTSCSGHPCTSVDYPFPRIPIVAAPTIVQNEERENIIIFGTGQIDGLETLDHHRVFALKEQIQYTVGASSAGTSRSEAEVLWWLGEEPLTDVINATGTWWTSIEAEMDGKLISADPPDDGVMDFFSLGEKLLGKPSVFEGVTYLTTFSPADSAVTQDACGSGGSKIWGVGYEDGSPSLVLESDPSESLYYDERAGELLTGLNVVRRPSCDGKASFQLVVQKANEDSVEAGGSSSTAPAVNSTHIKITSKNNGYATTLIDSWSLVFE